MVALQSRNKHWDQALETLKEAQQVLSDNYDLRLDRARVEIMRSGGKPDMKLLDDLASPQNPGRRMTRCSWRQDSQITIFHSKTTRVAKTN